MHYRKLGKWGLQLSELGLGSWITFGNTLDLKQVKEVMKQAFDAGINFFDNAEVYADGASEELMGKVLKDYERQSVVVSTKIFWGGQGVNDIGLSWKHLVEGTKRSLKRLQLEYVDLLYCHRPDPNTPVVETVRAMDYLIRSGCAFYWGTSEWSAQLIEEAHTVADKHHLIPPVVEQPQYNLFHRFRVEREYLPLYTKYGMGITSWSPLDSGILTGKYNEGLPENSRLAQHAWLRDHLTSYKIAKVKQLEEIARSLDCTTAQLAIAWCLKNESVSSVILGVTSTKQLQDNLKALDVKERLSNDLLNSINDIFS